MYIIDPANRTTYKDKVRDTLLFWTEIQPLISCPNGVEWAATVPPGTAFFNSVLALDIIYNDLTEEERTNIETILDNIAEIYWANNCPWKENQYGVRGIWALYQGDRPRIDQAKADYKTAVLQEFTADGVFNQGPAYAWARLGADRDAKAYFMDVLEFTGEDNTYYSNQQIKNFYEWLYAGSLTPFLGMFTFGDTEPERTFTEQYYRANPATLRSQKFSAQAATNANWALSNSPLTGKLLTYLLTDSQLPSAQKPTSRIWPDGMAAFWENNQATSSLAAALWNPKSQSDHSHKDVNAIHVAAYGENVLRNSGYAGWGNGCVGSNWAYVHDTAISSNTVLIDGVDHSTKVGSGITEGLTTSTLDYASGDSGSALPNGKHRRNLVFVHPQSGTNGYYVTFDEIVASNSNKKAQVAFHPSSSTYSTVSGSQEYKWTINQYSNHNVDLSIFLGTTPSTVEIKDGALCTASWTGFQSILGKYIYSTYNLSKGKKNIVTVHIPADDTHVKSALTRISTSNYSGASINHGNSVVDVALESSTNNPISYSGISFKGLAALYRKNGTTLSSYFVRQGTAFNDGTTPRRGFEATAPVSIYVKDTDGKTTSTALSSIKLYHPGIKGIKIDGQIAQLISFGTNWIQVAVPAGNHELTFTF